MTTKIDYSPKTLDDFVFFNDESEQTIRAIVSGDIEVPCMGTTGLLLYGSAGTGKTELAKLLPNFIEVARGGEATNFDFYACGEGDDGGEDDHRGGDDPEIAGAGTDLVFEEQSQHADRDGADDHPPAQPVVGGAAGGVGQAAEPGGEDAPDVLGEIDEHRGFGTQLGDGGERCPGVAGEEHPGRDGQMARRGHRQEFGEPLENGQHDRLPPAHCCHVSHADDRTVSGARGL